MTRSTLSLFRHAALTALVALLAFPPASVAVAQDRPDRAERHAQHTERLADALDLSEAQRALVAEATAEREAGTLWTLAAALTPTLTDAQKERLFTRPERPEHAEQPRADKPERPKRERMQRERPDADARAERREAHRNAMQAAMRSALNLSDAQVRELDALREARKAEWEARRADPTADGNERAQRRPAPGEVPAEIAAILTPEQQEVFEVHRALAMQMHHRAMRSRHAGR